MNARERAALIRDLQRLWAGWSDMRFGQMLRLAVGDPAIRRPRHLDNPTIAASARTALRRHPGRHRSRAHIGTPRTLAAGHSRTAYHGIGAGAAGARGRWPELGR